MLLLLFRLDDACFALDATEIVEILPLVTIIEVQHRPAGVAGLLNHRGALVPVVDLSVLALGRPALPRMSTRIILARSPEQAEKLPLLGLIAEQATDILRCEPTDLVASELVDPGPLSLGEACLTPHGLVQRIRLDRVMRAALPQ
jgi:chemotaxis-related protein WspB